MTQKQEDIITDIVKNTLFSNSESFSKSQIDTPTLFTIIKNGRNLLAKKWGLISYCNKFLDSIINNKLNETYINSDEINQSFIKILCYLK